MGCKQTKLDNLQESLKNIKKRARKKPPLLRLDQNKVYNSRLNLTCQKCMKIDEEIKKNLQQSPSNCPLNDNDIIGKAKEDKDQKNELLWQKYIQYKIKKSSYQKQESSYQSEETQKAQSYNQEIQSNSAQNIFKKQISQTPEKKEVDVKNQTALRKVTKIQPRSIQDVTIYLLHRGALKRS